MFNPRLSPSGPFLGASGIAGGIRQMVVVPAPAVQEIPAGAETVIDTWEAELTDVQAGNLLVSTLVFPLLFTVAAESADDAVPWLTALSKHTLGGGDLLTGQPLTWKAPIINGAAVQATYQPGQLVGVTTRTVAEANEGQTARTSVNVALAALPASWVCSINPGINAGVIVLAEHYVAP